MGTKSEKTTRFEPIDFESAHFLFPRYITGRVTYELSDELIATFGEYRKSKDLELIPRHYEWYDTADFNIQSLHNRGGHSSKSRLLAILYGPNTNYFPDPYSLIEVLDNWNGPRCLFLTDAVNTEATILTRQVRKHVDFIIGLDAKPNTASGGAAIFGPVLGPFSQATYKKWVSTRIDGIRPIDVGFFGTRYQRRIREHAYLVEQGIQASWVGGGYSGERLSMPQYLEKSCQTKIRVVTMQPYRYPRRAHLKGHVSEALMTKSLVLVDQSKPLLGLLNEGSEFIRYSSLGDLSEKVKYFLAHDDDRNAIATAGHMAFVNRLNLGNPWDMIFDSEG